MDVVVDRDTWRELAAENISLLSYYGYSMGTSCSRPSSILVKLGIFRKKKKLISVKVTLDFTNFSSNMSIPTGKVKLFFQPIMRNHDRKIKNLENCFQNQ